MKVHFEFHLDGSGWSSAALQIGDRTIRLTASYLSDALGDLVSAVAAIVDGAPALQSTFVEEPGEFLWSFEPVDVESVRVRIDWFDDWPSAGGVDEGAPRFDATCSKVALGRAVLVAADRVLEKHGARGYKQLWVHHEFPGTSIARLRKSLQRSIGATDHNITT